MTAGAVVGRLRSFVLPLVSVLIGLAVGAVAVLLSGTNPVDAYVALLQGSFTNNNAFTETLVATVPYVFLGLSVSVGFRAGLFNIGGSGQLFLGGIFAGFVGYRLAGLPAVLHLPLALLAGMLGGFLWGAIPGLLKARFGAHEVITTIMLNFIAALLTDLLVNKGPMSDPHTASPQTPAMLPSARLPIIVPDSRLHFGLFLALLAVPVVWFLLERTTLGFRIRAVGLNAAAARAAGISVGWTMVIVMGISGALAGLAGAVQVLGVSGVLTPSLSSGVAFDAIAVALLGGSNPFGVLPAALLFGALKSGASFMQLQTQVSADLISIVQAAVIVFVAAPLLVRWLFRLRAAPAARVSITEGGLGQTPPREGVA
ncbi:MAG TPA: ABC transporter permease [Candidatus Dormibacteraeota bacterium]|nr:ABC transporter permease [Candidatus Dormibacteraeota bacterium]